MDARLPFAVVHGRFQPFHREHLAYCLWALERGQALVVGITNYDRGAIVREATSSHRHTSAANPFAYWERALMVRDSLLEAGVPADRFSIVALPIDRPERWAEHVPVDPYTSVHLLRVFSAWEEEKVRRLKQAGLRVEYAIPPHKLLAATDVRGRIATDAAWDQDVPAATARWVRELDGVRRIRSLLAASSGGCCLPQQESEISTKETER